MIPAKILASIQPDPELAEQYVPLATQDVAIQQAPKMSQNEVRKCDLMGANAQFACLAIYMYNTASEGVSREYWGKQNDTRY